jgi:hypothetical protein
MDISGMHGRPQYQFDTFSWRERINSDVWPSDGALGIVLKVTNTAAVTPNPSTLIIRTTRRLPGLPMIAMIAIESANKTSSCERNRDRRPDS